jgi:molybdopterin-guanine dinucleotide biosynthesis protein A
MANRLDPEAVTGLVLAGGLGRRMGGADKGLQPLHGRPMAAWALARLAPQVNGVAINANRHLDEYRKLCPEVWRDTWPDFPGPLAGMLTGLQHMSTPWLLTVPCDVPFFPPDLSQKMMAAIRAENATLAIACSVEPTGHRRHPVFCLMHKSVQSSLHDYLLRGERKLDTWTAAHPRALVAYATAGAFENVNTLEDLVRLQASRTDGAC